METSKLKIIDLRKKRSFRVRKKLRGTTQKPRLCIIKSNSHIEAQIIDDEKNLTLFGISTRNKDLKKSGLGKKTKEAAKKLGELVSQAAKQNKIETMVFDRGSAKYHGILATLADTVRENGVKI